LERLTGDNFMALFKNSIVDQRPPAQVVGSQVGMNLGALVRQNREDQRGAALRDFEMRQKTQTLQQEQLAKQNEGLGITNTLLGQQAAEGAVDPFTTPGMQTFLREIMDASGLSDRATPQSKAEGALLPLILQAEQNRLANKRANDAREDDKKVTTAELLKMFTPLIYEFDKEGRQTFNLKEGVEPIAQQFGLPFLPKTPATPEEFSALAFLGGAVPGLGTTTGAWQGAKLGAKAPGGVWGKLGGAALGAGAGWVAGKTGSSFIPGMEEALEQSPGSATAGNAAGIIAGMIANPAGSVIKKVGPKAVGKVKGMFNRGPAQPPASSPRPPSTREPRRSQSSVPGNKRRNNQTVKDLENTANPSPEEVLRALRQSAGR
jgi:hypothetical protein